MDIRVLQYFLAVAREESITKAAKALQMTQPPLSRQLKDLEEEVGKQLLIRGSKKVTLTEDGMLLRKRAEEMIDLMEKTKAELSSSNENQRRNLYRRRRNRCDFLFCTGSRNIAEGTPADPLPHLQRRCRYRNRKNR